jgi:hypothetical protein
MTQPSIVVKTIFVGGCMTSFCISVWIHDLLRVYSWLIACVFRTYCVCIHELRVYSWLIAWLIACVFRTYCVCIHDLLRVYSGLIVLQLKKTAPRTDCWKVCCTSSIGLDWIKDKLNKIIKPQMDKVDEEIWSAWLKGVELDDPTIIHCTCPNRCFVWVKEKKNLHLPQKAHKLQSCCKKK